MAVVDGVHTTLDIPYWGAIVAATFSVRLILIPVSIFQQQQVARVAIMQPENDALREKYINNPEFNNSEELRLKYMEETRALMAKHGCNPLRTLSLPLLQLPIFLSFFTGLRGMPNYFPDLSSGGMLWFQDLCAADTTYALPILNALLFLSIVELGGNENKAAPPQQVKTMKNVLRCLAAITVPATAGFSQALQLYWFANNSFSVAQTLVLKQERVRSYFNIPKIPSKAHSTSTKESK